MKILIIEDELLVAISLINLVKELEPSSVIVGPIGSVKEAMEWLSSNSLPDLILSDIQLSDGISLDIFHGNKPSCPIIFTTAYDEYAIRAFKVNSIDYLLKPIEKSELQNAFQKFYLMQSKFSNDAYLQQMKELFSDFQKSKQYKERFAVHIGRSVTLIPTDEVALFIKEELIFLINRDGQKFITDYRSLDEVEELLNPKIFYRANRQHLVHLPFIESYRSDDTGKITLKIRGVKTTDLVVSKDKASEFRKWFD
jgi:DNA-binding LytR/AlgR family response regulator